MREVIKTFQLTFREKNFFPEIESIPIKIYEHTIQHGLLEALPRGSEKIRNELIIMPLMLELCELNDNKMTVYSGEFLNVDAQKKLNGECDFILSLSEIKAFVDAPIMVLVEAKKQDMEKGTDQCAAQMVGAKIFNEKQGKPYDTIFGCATTAETWRFLRLQNNELTLDSQSYGTESLDKVLGILQQIVDFYKK